MLNTATNRVAMGRRTAARRIVMNSLSSIPAQVWRKVPIYHNESDNTQAADPLSFEANTLSIQDEPSYQYDHCGYVYILVEKFSGGYIHKNYSMNNPNDAVIIAQIEAYDHELKSMSEKINNIPDFEFRTGDLLALMIHENFSIWFEITGNSGQTIMQDFGTKYFLSRRDEIGLNPVVDEVEQRQSI
ncbi:hypothetical protein [Acinetobacter chinensis]|uniref:hypothetical protein n=1 Tax=Acinetobacter chinensis TaxID=2004650 RepID=UPI002934240E|nr:hypothetical protein [Acinetobacter chinensis]WOE40062.1 hypothetical protein QSG87_09060 [Acinetobacter chinensis]